MTADGMLQGKCSWRLKCVNYKLCVMTSMVDVCMFILFILSNCAELHYRACQFFALPQIPVLKIAGRLTNFTTQPF